MAAQPRREKKPRVVALPRQSIPIVAINASGAVTKANASAKKVLEVASGSFEGVNLGQFLGNVMGRWRGHRKRTVLSIMERGAEREDVLVVLSNSTATSPAVAEAPAPALPRGPEARWLADFIAHELRNPMGTILGLSQVLAHRYSSMSQEDATSALRTIQAEAERAMLVLEALLRLAEKRTRSPRPLASVPLHVLVSGVLEAHRRRHPHRAITVAGDVPLFARADSMGLELALANLLSNAEKYTPRDRVIEVSFHEAGSNAVILILDNGSGLGEEAYPALWDIYAGGGSEAVTVRGSGIGLALCKELVESMGGHVWAGPREAGGSVFAVSLPVPRDTDVPAALSTPISQAAVSEAWAAPRALKWT